MRASGYLFWIQSDCNIFSTGSHLRHTGQSSVGHQNALNYVKHNGYYLVHSLRCREHPYRQTGALSIMQGGFILLNSCGAQVPGGTVCCTFFCHGEPEGRLLPQAPFCVSGEHLTHIMCKTLVHHNTKRGNPSRKVQGSKPTAAAGKARQLPQLRLSPEVPAGGPCWGVGGGVPRLHHTQAVKLCNGIRSCAKLSLGQGFKGVPKSSSPEAEV